jgi:hypothetical protein
LERFINVDKESGVRRVRSEAARQKALAEYLAKTGITVGELDALRERADRLFYTAADVERMSFGQCPLNGHDPDEICIPPNQIYGYLAQASDLARSATRVASRDQIRSVLTVTQPIYTGKSEPDGVFERSAVVTSGLGPQQRRRAAFAELAGIIDETNVLAADADQTAELRQALRALERWLQAGTSA